MSVADELYRQGYAIALSLTAFASFEKWNGYHSKECPAHIARFHNGHTVGLSPAKIRRHETFVAGGEAMKQSVVHYFAALQKQRPLGLIHLSTRIVISPELLWSSRLAIRRDS